MLKTLSVTKMTTLIAKILHLNPSRIWTNSKSFDESMNHIAATANLQNTRLYAMLLIVENPNWTKTLKTSIIPWKRGKRIQTTRTGAKTRVMNFWWKRVGEKKPCRREKTLSAVESTKRQENSPIDNRNDGQQTNYDSRETIKSVDVGDS